MYEFHYKYIKSKYDAKLLFTELSDYPQDSKFFGPANKKVVGRMKEEFKGKIISEFIGLKSKMYSLIAIDGEKI